MLMKEEILNTPIDAVITWVNGNDIVWQEKLNKHSKVKIDFNKKKQSKRYNSIGEIDIAIKSIIKFASFIRNIFLVTDNQTPDSFIELKQLADNKNINLIIIDHKVIFRGFEDCLPTFNSCSIGCMLYRIPNLSEHFIIFNDDTFLMRETAPSDFFIKNYPIIRGKWEKFRENRPFRIVYHKLLSFINKSTKKKTPSFKKFQQSSAKLANVTETYKYVRRFHTPVSIRKSTLETFYKENNILKENIKYKFRNENQFITSSLSEHLEIKNNTYHYRSHTQLTYFRSYKRPYITKFKLYWFIKNKKNIFMTFQSLEMADKKTLMYILNWIEFRLSLQKD